MKNGSHHTPEAIAKMRAAHTGKHPSEETRAKLSAAFTGLRRSPEWCANISVAKKGKKLPPRSPVACTNHSAARMGKKKSPEACAKMRAAWTPERRAKFSDELTGNKNPSWRGGISREPYGWEWNAELREEVRRRDGYKCQLCGVPQAECETKLPVHHADYDKKNSDPVNLVALCNSCNSKVNANRKHWTAFFQTLAIQRDIGC